MRFHTRTAIVVPVGWSGERRRLTLRALGGPPAPHFGLSIRADATAKGVVRCVLFPSPVRWLSVWCCS